MQISELVLFAAAVILAPLTLAVVVGFVVHRQNQRVLAKQADKGLQAMLQAGDFLGDLARDSSLPSNQRLRAQDLARHYPSGAQLHVFAESLLADLRRASRKLS